jgi:AraC-like DNA-binding protein
LVSGGEALRLKIFLSEQRLALPKIFHQLAKTPDEAALSRISGRVLLKALEAAMRTLRQPALPIEFGSSIRAADMGIYGFVIQTAPNVGEAFTRSVHFQRLMTTSARVYLDYGENTVRWIWSSTDERNLGARVRNEVVLTEHVALLRATAPGLEPLSVAFVHPAPTDDLAHRKFFACAIKWSAPEDSVTWPLKAMQRRLGGDPDLSTFIEREAERRLALLPANGTSDLVKDAILQRMSSGRVDLTSIAATLGKSSRTLRRELANDGIPFRTLLDTVRRQRAVDMAKNGTHSMTQISLHVGFSEVSAFSRAWRRWFQQS